MNQKKFSQDQNPDENDFAPSPDEVARRAYFAYENNGSLQGHEVQHWLAAEADLIAERKLTRTHGFHHHAARQNSPPMHKEKINL